LIAWILRLSALVKLISDSILVGFKAGAGLTIAMTQLPSLFGLPGGGHNFIERTVLLAGQLGQTHYLVLALGIIAILLLVLGERLLPGKPVALGVVALSIIAASVFGLAALGVPTTGEIPAGLPTFAGPSARSRDIEGIFPLAAGCLLLAYIEGVSAARTFAAKHGYALDARQELLGIGAANFITALGHGYPVAGGLSQSAVNDKAGARTPLALVFASITLALCLLFLTEPTEGHFGRGGDDGGGWPAGLSGVVSHVACEPDRLLCSRDRAWRRTALGNTAGHSACGACVGLDVAGQRFASVRGVSRPDPRNQRLLRYGATSGE
jgi:MFS superfamily sulfate permease-like transporter